MIRSLRGVEQIKEGATVHERQRILTVVNLDAPMLINALIGESMVDRLRRAEGQGPGRRVPRRDLHRRRDHRRPNARRGHLARSERKIYPTLIRIENGIKGLRPGMSGDAEITVVEREKRVHRADRRLLPTRARTTWP